ncbi:hypothetical protein CYK21_00305 [Streptococcus macedonicus]|uniref:Phage tail protein n=2 Tax=Streptococcus TaxID=1301 RepID=A0AAW6YBS5_9STRE|nr:MULTISPECIES: phage tail protein [Streptococcus]MDK7292397.1 phage tail protein [Streptococcus pasteurianus]MDK7292444.1 phage tail protein [Streptococcus pasteurianus]PLA54598.1 hypothetical protein CYK21_00305 [Streptococcus macedonicus]
MITFLNEKDVEHGALASIKITNAVNGERSLSGEIESGDYVLSNIERGWRLRFDDEFYVVTYAKPIDEGKSTHVTFDAVHQFFWDFDKSSVHEQLNDGSHTFVTYLDFIFKDSGYTYTIDPLLKVYAFEKQSFGYKSRLKLFNDIITSSGVEFQVNGKVVRILEKTGTDLSTVVRKNFNMNELGIEKNISDFVTYQKGFGAWFDENDHTKGRLTVEYTSPLASVYGKLEAEPLVDERYTKADSMTAALKENVDNSYSISITLDMEDLTRAGYKYTQPVAGDYIMAINETLGFKEKIRIVSFTSEYDVTGQLVKHEVTCNDIGAVKKLSASYTLAKEQAQNASDSVVKAVEMANKALVSADGKNTVYFGTEFPEDEPKGTLHKGDSLYLTVGDTTKMYYWTGADWEELPIVNDVEAFKEQIADELKDVPDREEFEATITEKLATSKAELETQIDTAKTQVETNAKAYADEINQATAEVAKQANTAANSLKSDLAKVKTDLTATTSTANAAKTSASEAKQQLTTVANDLSTAKQDLQAQASQLTAQASAQSELTKRVSTVEETANGTKTTVSELSKTVDSNTQNITSVTARTKTVEDDLTSTKTTLSQVKTTVDNTSKKTATLETGLNGVKADLTATTTTANTTKTNLANYQASNDKLVASLQSNLQTTNGNVSSLQTKVEAVPGQISSAISTVEGKIPTSIGGRNLWIQSKATGGFVEETLPDNHITGQKKCYRIPNNKELSFNIEPNFSSRLYRKVTFSAWVKYENVVQGTNNWNVFNCFKHTLYLKNSSTGATSTANYLTLGGFVGTSDWKYITYTYDYAAIKSYDQLKTTIHFNLEGAKSGTAWVTGVKVEVGSIPSDYTPAPEDTVSQISSLSSQIQQTADGMTLLATKTELNSAKTELQSGITTATNKANTAQSTATNNAKTISTHTTQISALNTGLSAKVSQTDFNTLSGRVTTAENNITAKANELSSKITSVEGKIPTSVGGTNLLLYSADPWKAPNDYYQNAGAIKTDETLNGSIVYKTRSAWASLRSNWGKHLIDRKNVKVGDEFTYSIYAKTDQSSIRVRLFIRFSGQINAEALTSDITITNEWQKLSATFKVTQKMVASQSKVSWVGFEQTSNSEDGKFVYYACNKLERGNIPTDYQPAPEDYDSALATAQSEIKQTTDAITASVSALDKSTVKSSSLTINTDGIVMKAGKSTTDVANAIGSYFAVNQNAINLFSDKINVKGNMIVSGAITSDKIASKSITTAHLNGKIITADVISSNAVTADALKAGAVTTDKMSANSINGDRITAGTLDAAKIKAGSITASQIASGTITSSQIKTGGITAANIATGAITTDKIAANSINSDKIVTSGITANVIKGGKLQSLSNATNFELDTGKLFYNNNNTGIFRVQANASTMGLKFSNTSITVSGTSRILSRVILGGDRRETTLDDGKWDQGGFSGIVVETINGVAANDHERADSLRVIADNIYFGHSYNKDVVTNLQSQGWKMETYPPTSTYPSHVVLRPYGISYRNADIITGDVRLDNGDGSGYYVRSCIQILRNCFQHIINGGTSSNAINAIRSAISQISGV